MIETKSGITQYVSTGTVVLVSILGSGSNTTSVAAGSETTSGAPNSDTATELLFLA